MKSTRLNNYFRNKSQRCVQSSISHNKKAKKSIMQCFPQRVVLRQLPHQLVFLRHTFILNFMLKNTVDQTSCITDALISLPFILHPAGNTDY